MRMILGLTEALPKLVDAKFASAKASDSLLFSHTELAVIRTSAGLPVSTGISYKYITVLLIGLYDGT